jgi:hypothetical protein
MADGGANLIEEFVSEVADGGAELTDLYSLLSSAYDAYVADFEGDTEDIVSALEFEQQALEDLRDALLNELAQAMIDGTDPSGILANLEVIEQALAGLTDTIEETSEAYSTLAEDVHEVNGHLGGTGSRILSDFLGGDQKTPDGENEDSLADKIEGEIQKIANATLYGEQTIDEFIATIESMGEVVQDDAVSALQSLVSTLEDNLAYALLTGSQNVEYYTDKLAEARDMLEAIGEEATSTGDKLSGFGNFDTYDDFTRAMEKAQSEISLRDSDPAAYAALHGGVLLDSGLIGHNVQNNERLIGDMTSAIRGLKIDNHFYVDSEEISASMEQRIVIYSQLAAV